MIYDIREYAKDDIGALKALWCDVFGDPPELVDRIQPIGNAAGEGAKLCSLSGAEFAYAARLAEETEFLELAALPEFQDCYVDCLTFEEDDE